jgi:hypothetical protein
MQAKPFAHERVISVGRVSDKQTLSDEQKMPEEAGYQSYHGFATEQENPGLAFSVVGLSAVVQGRGIRGR